jgi:hypothetical protein
MYDPIELAEEIGKVVNAEEKRKYYRFRPAPYYGGIATADCVGCCLRCLFCWRATPSDLGVNWDKADFTPTELAKGMKIEEEHGDKDPRETAKVALDHLHERGDYYKLLKEKGVKSLDDFNAFMREVSKEVVETLLEGELTDI